MSCMSDITSLAFSFHTLTFFVKVRISWNSWPLFSCWLQSCDVGLRLGSRVCVCVCLFCSVVVALFVVGWQQHCRCIVIDAMVYPKSWKLEDKFGTGKTLKSLDWVCYSYIWFRRFIFQQYVSWRSFSSVMTYVHIWSCMSFTFVFNRRVLNLELTTLCMSRARWVFWMMLHHLSCVLEDVSVFDYFDYGCEVDEMPCRKGVWKFDTLWEHPLGKGEATCHSLSLYSFIHRRYVEDYCKSSSRTHDADGREHPTCCGRNLCIWPTGWSQYSISLRTYHPLTFWDVIDQCWSECGVLISSTSYSGFCLSLVAWYSLLLELKIPTLTWHWGFVLCLRHWEVYSLQVMRTQLETLGEEFKLAGNIWWGETTILWVLRQQDVLALWRQWPHWHILFVWRVLWWDVSVLWGQYLHPRHRDLRIIHLILWCVFYRSLRRLWLSLWGRHCLETTLFYIVDWLLQWSKDFSDTTVFGWPTLTMLNRTFYSTLRFEAVRWYLYVESWFGGGTLCSDYVWYSEEGCTHTLCESLRSWEVSQLAN